MGGFVAFSIDRQPQKEIEMHIVIQGAGRGIGHAMVKQAMAAGATQHPDRTAPGPHCRIS